MTMSFWDNVKLVLIVGLMMGLIFTPFIHFIGISIALNAGSFWKTFITCFLWGSGISTFLALVGWFK